MSFDDDHPSDIVPSDEAIDIFARMLVELAEETTLSQAEPAAGEGANAPAEESLAGDEDE